IIERRHGMHYGIPPQASAHDGIKVAKHHHRNETVDPDAYDRAVSAADEALIRAAMAEYIPAANGRLIAAKTCLYTMTPDGDFRHRSPARRLQYHRRFALLRSWLQVRAGDRRDSGRPRHHRCDAP